MQDMTFEQAMQRLEEIVSRLEAGDAPLDKSMTLFEEGTKLSAYLSGLLDSAEQKVTMITTANGTQTVQSFDTEGDA